VKFAIIGISGIIHLKSLKSTAVRSTEKTPVPANGHAYKKWWKWSLKDALANIISARRKFLHQKI
jgi:hypothetical protein